MGNHDVENPISTNVKKVRFIDLVAVLSIKET